MKNKCCESEKTLGNIWVNVKVREKKKYCSFPALFKASSRNKHYTNHTL